MNVKKLLFKILFFVSVGVWSQNISLMGGDLPADGVQMSTSDNITYTLSSINLSATWVKFRQGNDWTVNWGANNFPSGTGVQDGPNISVGTAGVYNVTFNRTTGAYNFQQVIDPFGNFGAYATAIWIHQSGGTSTFYNTSYRSPNGFQTNNDHAINQDLGMVFQGRNFGAYNTISNDLRINGVEIKTFKRNNGNNCAGQLFYTAYPQGQRPISPTFNSGNTGFFNSCNLGENRFPDEPGHGPCNDAGYQKWQGLNGWPQNDSKYFAPVDLTNRNEGNYVLEIFYRIPGHNTDNSSCDQEDFDNAGGANYTANFTICPVISGNSFSDPTTCGGNGTITLNIQGVADGTYSDRFYYGPEADGTTFSNVVVSGGVATITVPSGTYNNVRYWNTTGCLPIGNLDFTLTEPTIPSAPVSGGNQTVCATSPIQTLTATANVPANHTVRWFDQAVGGTEVTPTLNTVGSASYFAEAVSNTSTCTSATRTEVVLTINPAPLVPELDADDSNRTQCEQSPIQTIDANNSIINVPAGFTVKWYDAPSGGNEVSTPIRNTVGSSTYYAVLVDDVTLCESNTRTPVTLTILQGPIKPVVIDSGIRTECSTTPIQTLNASNYVQPVAGFEFVWFSQENGGSPIVGEPILNTVGTVTYYVALQNESTLCQSTERSAVTLTINETPAVPQVSTNCDSGFGEAVVTVTSPVGGEYEYALDGGTYQDNSIFTGVDNGSRTITVRNKITGCTNISNLSTFAPVDCGCATRTSLSLDSTFDSTCSSEAFSITNVRFGGSATQVNITHDGAGTLSVNSSNVSPFDVTYVPDVLDSGKNINITFTTNNPLDFPCVASQQIFALTVNAIPSVPVLFDGGILTECESNPIQTLNANTLVDLPAGFTAKWYTDLVGGTEVVNPILNTVNSVTYYLALENNTTLCEGTTRVPVQLTITPAPIDADKISNIIECESSPIQTLNANNAITPQAGYTVRWYDAITGGNIVNNPIRNTVGSSTYYAVYENDLTGCQSNTRVQVDLTINPTSPNPQLDADDSKRTQCEASPIQTLNANSSIVNVPDGYSVKWYDINSVEVLNPALSTIGTVTYFAVLRNNVTNCESNSSTSVTLTISASPKDLEIDANNNQREQCKENPIQILDANNSVINKPNGFTVKWYDDNNNIVLSPTLNMVGTITYYGVLVDDLTGCESLNRVPVTLTILDSEILVIDDSLKNQIFCNNTNIPTVASLQPSGANIRWYATPTGGAPLNVTDVLSDNTSYYGVLVSPNGCESAERTPVLVNLACVSDLAVTYTVNAQNGCNYIGSPLTFTITATNNGNNEATGVNLTALLPSGYLYNIHSTSVGNYDINSGVWSIGNLSVGATQTLTIDAAIRAALPGETDSIYHGTAVISGNEPDPDLNNNTDTIDNNDISVCQVANLVTTVRVVDGVAGNIIPNATPKVGSQVVFQIFVENAGPSIGKDVELTNTLPIGYTFVKAEFDEETVVGQNIFNSSTGKWVIGELNYNTKSAVLYLTATVNANANIGAGDYTEIAAAFGSVFDNDLTNNTAQVTPNPVPQYDLVMNKSVDNSTPPIETEVTFTLTVTNQGPSHATAVTVTDLLPSGFTYRSHTVGQDYNPATGTWNIGDLQTNQSITMNMVVYVNATGDYNNIAVVNIVPENEISPSDNTDNEEVFPTPKSDVEIEKTTPVKGARENDVVEYTINIVNTGPSDATGVIVTDKLPDNLSYVWHTPGQDYNPTTGVWTVGNLANQATATLIIRTVVKDSDETIIRNTATVTSNTLDHQVNNNISTSEIIYTRDCELRVYNYVSANNDGKNDYFIIENIDCYPDNTVEIYNRWGVRVFQTTGYGSDISQNVFTGISDGRATVSQDKTLPEGTYFYIIQYKGDQGSGSKSGYLELTR